MLLIESKRIKCRQECIFRDFHFYADGIGREKIAHELLSPGEQVQSQRRRDSYYVSNVRPSKFELRDSGS